MNQKAFAIFVGGIMVLSAFAGFMLRGGNQSNAASVIATPSLQTFGVQGRLVDWKFDNLEDVLEMSPDNTVMAYWINLSASQNLSEVARATFPQSFALTYGTQLYPSRIERFAVAYFNNSSTEFHWIRPFRVAYSGLVVPYNDYMMIPSSTDLVSVMGRPTLFGTQGAVERVLDVISGGLPTDKFTLPLDEYADLQIAALGKGVTGSLLPGGYNESYLGVSRANDGFNVAIKYLQPDEKVQQRAKELAGKYGLNYSSQDSKTEISGQIEMADLRDVIVAFLRP